ncbi:MAG: MBL fold metallo-hydrolase [Patescibacteria group bacterium]|nr:MBL fold metallo-hydrolase [Patescibacteria group bacterium]
MAEIKRTKANLILTTNRVLTGYTLRVLIGILGAFIGLILTVLLTAPDSKLHVKFFNVGEGDSIFVKTPSNYKVLIDGGPDNRVLQYLGSELPFYDRKIDLIISTHPHADHLTGLLEVVKRYQIGQVWLEAVPYKSDLYQSWLKILQKEKIKVGRPKVGDYLNFGDGVTLKILWPLDLKLATEEEVNETSIVSLLTFGQFSALLSGDAGEKSQPYYQNSITVLKVPHQGAGTALKEEFLKKLSPTMSIISLGQSNKYGHPAKETLMELESVHSKVFRTDRNGSVEVVSDGRTWYTRAER